MEELVQVLSKAADMRIVNEHRRCETDAAGVDLPNGRDHYGLWNWYIDGKSSEWPGFWNVEDCIKDMIKNNK